MAQSLQFGLDTFGDVTEDAEGNLLSKAQVIRNVIAEAVVADQHGVDVFGIGEHHRDDFAVSSPETVLAAIAGQTSRIRLGSAVTVLSSDDPVRVFERFSTLNAASNGRAEVILGRGSFTESFPLFGYDLSQYELLFEEKLALFAELLKGGPVSWRGTTRTGLLDQHVYPELDTPLTTWVGVGGSPESVARAARFQLPLTLAIIGGSPLRFKPLVDFYRQSLDTAGAPPLPVAIHSPGYVAESDEEALEEFFPHMKETRDRIGAERGWGPMTRESFDREASEHGSLYIGSPDTVARKIARTIRALGVERFDMKYSDGRLPHEKLVRCIELYGSKVIPMVRELLGE
ncbi:MAG TPA: LLM class flavin-dependent oxidoreductase [Acidimicrobiales bacterium]|jgi:probable LLM family oxidoreductase